MSEITAFSVFIVIAILLVTLVVLLIRHNCDHEDFYWTTHHGYYVKHCSRCTCSVMIGKDNGGVRLIDGVVYAKTESPSGGCKACCFGGEDDLSKIRCNAVDCVGDEVWREVK